MRNDTDQWVSGADTIAPAGCVAGLLYDIECGVSTAQCPLNAAIPHSALYLSVTKQKLDGAQISGAPIDQCHLEEHASCKAMSAFMVAIRCKADMRGCNAHVCF